MIKSLSKRFNLSGNKQKVVSNVFWSLMGKVVNIVSGLLVGIFVARYLGPDRFGLMNYVIGYVTLFSILSTFGLDGIEIRELAKGTIDKNIVISSALCVRLALAAATILLILVTLLLFESDRNTILLVMIYSLTLICISFNVLRNYFTSIVLNEYVVKSEIVRTIVISGIQVVLLFYKYPLIYFIATSTFGFLLIANGYFWAYKKKVGELKFTFSTEVAKSLLKSSFPLLLSGAAVVIYQKIDQVMIRNMIDNKAVGQFSVASKLTELVIFLPNVLAQTLMPLLVKAHQQGEEIYFAKRQQFINVMVWVAIIMAVFISLTAHFVITLLYGSVYSEAVPVLQIMAFKAVFVALFASSGRLIVLENM